MKFHRSIVPILVMIVTGIVISCGSGDQESAQDSETPLPPSLSGEDTRLSSKAVNLTGEQSKQLNIETRVLKSNKLSYTLPVPGVTFPSPDNIFMVSAPISGRITAIYAHEGEMLRKGQLLLEIESLEFANLVADFMKAGAEEDFAITQYDRIEQLVEKGISPQSALDRAAADLARAKALARAAEATLKAVGVRDEQIIQWQAGSDNQPNLKIYSPINGVLTEHLIDLGQAINSNEKMLTVMNLSKVLVRGFISPEDAGLVQPGDSIYVTLKDFPGRKLPAVVNTINPALDPLNKSVTLNVNVETPEGWPKPGQNVRLEVLVSTNIPVIAIPLSSIEYEGDLPAVFVKTSDNSYQKRLISISRMTDNAAIVDSGLKDGEIVAVSQIFSLKALAKYEEFAE